MYVSTAMALADSLDDKEKAKGLLYPELSRVRAVSGKIALSVIKVLQEQVSHSQHSL